MSATDDSIEIKNDDDDIDVRQNQISTSNTPTQSSPPSVLPPLEIPIPETISIDAEALPIEQDLPRPFDNVSKDLAGLGALSIDDFLSNVNATSVVFDVSFHVQLPESSALKEREDIERDGDGDRGVAQDEDSQIRADEQKMNRSMIAKLHEASNKVFGCSDCLKFEYMEEDSKNKQCILTVTRPNGATRSYKSDPDAGFTRRQEARIQAAKIAVEMGAIDFIVSGDADAMRAKKGLLLNPFDVEIDTELNEVTPGMSKYTEEEEPLQLIEDACVEWRAGKVKPHWVTYNDSKNKKKHGAALRISLNLHLFRSYSVDPIFNYQRLAKLACARTAVKEGVLDFIKFGNGQTQPAKLDDHEESSNVLRELTPPPLLKGMALQEFFETLPQPFPENIGETSVSEFNASAWLNLTLQSARGGRLISSYTPIIDGVRRLHGCILRIERPGEARTFLVDPQFSKRSDARSAVCLLAMSQGVGAYIRGLKEEAENKISPAKRKLANEKLLQILSFECNKVKPGNRLTYTFATERDAFGCTLRVDVSSKEPDILEYTVNTEFRNKADAKAAVACLAAEQGLVDLLRFKGGPLPSDYTPFWESVALGNSDNYVSKRKDRDREFDSDVHDRKRRKGNFRDKRSYSEMGNFTSNMRLKARDESDGASLFRKQPPTAPLALLKNGWRKPRGPGFSNGLSPTNAYMRTVGQGRSEYRNSGASSNAQSTDQSVVHLPTAPRAFSEKNWTSAGNTKRSHDTRRVNSLDGQSLDPQYSGSPQNDVLYSTPKTEEHQTQQTHSYPRDEMPVGSATPGQGYPDGYVQTPTYPQPPSYPTGSYPYMAPYTYPPSPVGVYPTPYAPPPPSYAVYYAPHPAAAPVPYPQYTHPPQYPSQYPNGHYVAYSTQSHYGAPPSPQGVISPSYPTPVSPTNLSPAHYSPRYLSPSYSPCRYTTPSSSKSPHSPHGGSHERKSPAVDNRQNGSRHHREESKGDKSSIAHDRKQSPGVQVKQESTDDSRLLKVSEPAPPGSNLAALYDFCKEGKTPKPKFMFAIVDDAQGEKKFKVWAEQYSQRLELPTLFSNYEDGRDRLAKRVLHWMRKRNNAVQ